MSYIFTKSQICICINNKNFKKKKKRERLGSVWFTEKPSATKETSTTLLQSSNLACCIKSRTGDEK